MSICNGVDVILKRYEKVASDHIQNLNVDSLMAEMLARVEMNWQISPRHLAEKRPSKENWRLERKLDIAPHNESPEKTLEKAIAKLTDWYNQIPTASGLYDQHSDKLRNIDLVHQLSPAHFEFIELKVTSDTPEKAAMEILQYAVLYVFACLHYTEAEKQAKELLGATQVYLRVLAPPAYYWGSNNLQELATRFNIGLSAFSETVRAGCQMDFAFWAFPKDFVWPCGEDDLRFAMSRIVPLEWGGG